ncbi:hypothetical protein [Amycolatopsis anabasis]|uniref:hypothetical protein n=1 Tax=Amycolatopsis anabasis TaxID=1840409 RepID=UPI00131D287C|nr:hypothetical protein [Amycolatopsis anabasis]
MAGQDLRGKVVVIGGGAKNLGGLLSTTLESPRCTHSWGDSAPGQKRTGPARAGVPGPDR